MSLAQKAAEAGYHGLALQKEGSGPHLGAAIDAAHDLGLFAGVYEAWPAHDDGSSTSALLTAHPNADFYVAEAERAHDWDSFFAGLRRNFPTLPMAVVTNMGGLALPTDARGNARTWADRAWWDLSKEPNVQRAANLVRLHAASVYCLVEADLPANSQATPPAMVFEALNRGWSPDEISVVEYLYAGKTHNDYPGLDTQPAYWTWLAESILSWG